MNTEHPSVIIQIKTKQNFLSVVPGWDLVRQQWAV